MERPFQEVEGWKNQEERRAAEDLYQDSGSEGYNQGGYNQRGYDQGGFGQRGY